jgi:hypothetical protein
MNSVKRLPVPSIPGSNTSLARVLGTELMLAGLLHLVCLENGIIGNLLVPDPSGMGSYRKTGTKRGTKLADNVSRYAKPYALNKPLGHDSTAEQWRT